MNRDRDSVQFIAALMSPTSISSSSVAAAEDQATGLSRIKATALLLKQKVAGTSVKPQKLPNKISHPWALNSASRASSFPSPTSPPSSTITTSSYGAQKRRESIKTMIAVREDPSLSNNKMAPHGTQPAPLPQRRDSVRAGTTLVQLSPQLDDNDNDQRQRDQRQQHQQRQAQVGAQAQTQSPPPTPVDDTNHGEQQRQQRLEQQQQQVLGETSGCDQQAAPGMHHQQHLDSRTPSSPDSSRRSARRRNAGGDALVPSQFSAPASSPNTPLFMKAFQNPDAILAPSALAATAPVVPSVPSSLTTADTKITAKSSSSNVVGAPTTTTATADTAHTPIRSTEGSHCAPHDHDAQHRQSGSGHGDGNGHVDNREVSATPTSVEGSSAGRRSDMAASCATDSRVSGQEQSDTRAVNKGEGRNNVLNIRTDGLGEGAPSLDSMAKTCSSSSASATPPMTPRTSSAAATKSFLSVLDQRPPPSPRRHTTSTSSPSSDAAAAFFAPPPDTPSSSPLPSFSFNMSQAQTQPQPQQQQPQQQQQQQHHHHHHHHRAINPTLRQLQTPRIPVNLVQARILQQEEQRRRDEELAKIPITANLRTVKKIHAVVVDENELDDNSRQLSKKNNDNNNNPSQSLQVPSSPRSPNRPRAKTATSSSVSVSILMGGKQRGDRNHVEPVAIPKKLAEQVEQILGRKIAGKASVLDEREKEKEEEEARKANEVLAPIVRGKPRKRAMTSEHIRNMVSSWDHKVEEAKEIVQEADKIRMFLEERSTAHAELPKFSKVTLTGSELLKPLPSLPPPPPTSAFILSSKNNKVSSSSSSSRKNGGSKHVKSTSAGSTSSSWSSSSSVLAPFPSPSPPPSTSYNRYGSTLSSSSLDSVEETSAEMDEVKVVIATTTTTTNNNNNNNNQEKQCSVNASASISSVMPRVLDTERSGQVLDNMAVLSRPRRPGVRRATTTTVNL